MKTVLTIAGSDCSGGAGIQADLKTITAYGMYGMTVITALTVQNTMGVSAVQEAEGRILCGQLEAVFTDIMPDAVKIGMLPSEKSVIIVAEALERYRPEHVVLDPVMVSTSGRSLMDISAKKAMVDRLFPRVSLITPNVPEAEVLSGGMKDEPEAGSLSGGGLDMIRKIDTPAGMERAAKVIGGRYHTSVLLKGGHMTGGADDCLYSAGQISWFRGKRLEVSNTHGTGCTLSTAIACGFAMGLPAVEAVDAAKRYITEALKNEPGLGHGNGPLNHCFAIPEAFGRGKE